jgi:hypothetical protein
MVQKTIAQNQGDSGRVNLSGSELDQFGGDIGDEVTVDVADSAAIAKAMIDNKDTNSYIIISKPVQEPEEDSK